MLDTKPEHTPSPTVSVSFWQAICFWWKLGWISFGGPAGQIAIMHQELVEKRRWISEQRFLHALNYCMLLPGPEAQQLATYLGWLLHKKRWGILAGVLFVLPSLAILIALAWVYMRFGDLALVQNLFYGIKPAVVAIVAHAAYRIGSRTITTPLMVGIASGSFIAIFFMNIPFPFIVAIAALLGFVLSQYRPNWFKSAHSHGSQHNTADHHIIQPPHTRFSWHGLIKIVTIGLLLWAIPMAALTLYFGWDHTLTQMSWFFTKAALLTFGGAYAVLPYVYQGAVLDYQWLSATQMIDSLALGETTPGPLIMVVAFVGFIGAYIKALFGPDALFLAGASAALLITWFIFLPSFIFILAGGPLIESTHNKLEFTAPLSAITAAVVGVIINLGLFFAYHVGWPNGFGDNAVMGLDPLALGIASLAALAIFKFRVNLIVLIASCAALGVLLKTAW